MIHEIGSDVKVKKYVERMSADGLARAPVECKPQRKNRSGESRRIKTAPALEREVYCPRLGRKKVVNLAIVYMFSVKYVFRLQIRS
jgi:hypothetical protein